MLLDCYRQKQEGEKAVAKTTNQLICIIAILFITLQAFRWSYYQRDTAPDIASFLSKPQKIDIYTKIEGTKI